MLPLMLQAAVDDDELRGIIAGFFFAASAVPLGAEISVVTTTSRSRVRRIIAWYSKTRRRDYAAVQ
jgi:hypothetical protein